MKRFFKVVILSISLLVVFFGCSTGPRNIIFDRGEGMVTINCPAPFDMDTLNLWYYIPEGDQSRMPVQIVMHGVGRNADEYLRSWEEDADRYGFAVLVPEFDDGQFPEPVYHQGNVIDSDGNFLPKENLTYNILNKAFEYFTANSRLTAKKFNIYGHSAGAQFVHRFLQFGDTKYVAKAVAANSGWYTLPTDTLDFPYGQGQAKQVLGLSNQDYYAKDLVILLGTADTLRRGALRMTPEADKQGLTRLARGENFFARAKAEAASLGCEFGWSKRYVNGVGHSNEQMAPAAARILYAEQAGLSFTGTGFGTTYYVPEKAFTKYPVPVQYYLPENYDPKTLKVLVNMHGGARHNMDSMTEFKNCADQNNLMLLGVDFDEKDYPNSIFLYGGLRDDSNNFRSVDNSIYAIIDNVFLEAKKQLKFKSDKYDIYGHSAGAQTAQRFMLFYDKTRVDRVLAANCGWYTYPDVDIEFPYGIEGCADYYGLDLKEYLASKMTIAVGSADTVVNFGLRMNKFTLKQGANRYERGIDFYNYGKSLSEKLGCPFNWNLVVMDGIGHDEVGAVRCAERTFFGKEYSDRKHY